MITHTYQLAECNHRCQRTWYI